jgi:hypothetical protein
VVEPELELRGPPRRRPSRSFSWDVWGRVKKERGQKEGRMDVLQDRVGEQVEVVVSSTRSSYKGTLTSVGDGGLLLRTSEGDKRSEAYHYYPWYSVPYVSFPVDLPK